MAIIIKKGTIWYQNDWFIGDMLIKDGLIKEISEGIEIKEDDEVIDAKEHIVIPGLIDMHVHLREPGFEEKETIETGVSAAARGGFTQIAAMPNTNPVIDHADLLDFVHHKSKEVKKTKVLQIAAITKGEQGKELTDMQTLKEHGTIGFSDDGKGIQTGLVMKRAMEKAASLNMPIISHCEDESLANKGVIHDGEKAKELGIPGIPSESEYVQLAKEMMLAELTGVHYHICHVSSSKSVELIREAKAKGINITAEVTPHHLLLTEDDIREPYSSFKMNPPLRTKDDRNELLEGLLDGTIDIIATDHAPHTEAEKKKGIIDAPFGIVGLETAFPLMYTQFVMENGIELERLINWLSTNPSEIFKLQGGIIELNKTADIAIIDIKNPRVVNKGEFASKGRNTPFHGKELYGWPLYTIVDGQLVWKQED